MKSKKEIKSKKGLRKKKTMLMEEAIVLLVSLKGANWKKKFMKP